MQDVPAYLPLGAAQIPDLNWNDLRVLLAVSRHGTLAAAARSLRVDETTVARRLSAAETAIGARLFQRVGTGALRPTGAGDLALAEAERAEQAVGALCTATSQVDTVAAGTVRLTAVPILVNRLLVPALHDLAACQPMLRLELIAEPRDLSLTRREADIALRLARPMSDAGAAVLVRCVGRLCFAAYAPASASAGMATSLPWIVYEEGMSALPQAGWLAARSSAPALLALNDAETILHAVAAGLGRSVLPCVIADRDPALRRLDATELPEVPARELWVLTHPDQRRLARVTAVLEWLDRTLATAGIATNASGNE